MNLVPVEYHGVHVVGPEEFFCAILRWPEENKFLPVWMSYIEGARLAAVEAEDVTTRPTTHDVLADALSRLDGGVSTIALTSYHEGVFVATIVAGGEEIDARASDAIIVAALLDMPLSVSEDILTQTALFITDDELQTYLDLEPPADAPDASAAVEEDVVADADFDEMLRSLGMMDPEESSDTEDSEDTDETEDK